MLLASGTNAAKGQTWSSGSNKFAVTSGAKLLILDVGSLPALPNSASIPGTSANSVSVAGADNAKCPNWSPNDRYMTYLSGSALILKDMNTQKNREVDANVISPVVWAPDSGSYSYIHKEAAGQLIVRTKNPEGGDITHAQLPFHQLSSPSTQAIAWVPHTDNVVINAGDNGKNDLYLIDSAQPVKLTSTGDVLGFVVSADGSTIRWARRSSNTHYILMQLYDMDIAKRTITKLTIPDAIPLVNPKPRSAVDSVFSVSFSPDMNNIAFVTLGGPGAGRNGAALYVSDIEMKNVKLVGRGQKKSDSQADSIWTGLTFPAMTPAFSPESKRLAAVRSDGRTNSILVYDVDTGQMHAGALSR